MPLMKGLSSNLPEGTKKNPETLSLSLKNDPDF
jgi:hypothetical protein